MIPAAPLREAIQKDADSYVDDYHPRGIYELGSRIGIDGRCLKRVLTQETVTMSFADTYCCRTNRHLALLYPDLYA
jgi:hypothetical protein